MIILTGMSYPIKFRLHILSVREKEGLTLTEASTCFKVGISSLTRWLRRPEPRPSGPRRGKIDMEALARDVKQYPDAYQFERAIRFSVCQKAIWQALRRLGVTYKKSLAAPQGERRQTAQLPAKD
jgi:transposase